MKPFAKALFGIVAAALVQLGCGVSDEPIRILGAYGMSGDSLSECSRSDIQQFRGSLDISAQTNYLISFDYQSNLQPVSETVGGDPINFGNRNDFYANELVLQYRSVPDRGFQPEVVPIHFVAPAGAQSAGNIRMLLLTPEVAERLATELLPGDEVELLITLQFRGTLGHGGSTRSNEVTFPVRVFNSGFTGCATGFQLEATGPCGLGGGQDGSPVRCAPVSSSP